MKVKMLTNEGECEIAPGCKTALVPRDAVPHYGIAQLMRQPDGTYLPVLRLLDGTMRLTSNIGERLGVDVSYQTIHRLILGGFIEGRYIAPKTCLLNLGSFWRHYQASLDPEFWTAERLERYREGCRIFAARSRDGLQPENSDEK